ATAAGAADDADAAADARAPRYGASRNGAPTCRAASTARGRAPGSAASRYRAPGSAASRCRAPGSAASRGRASASAPSAAAAAPGREFFAERCALPVAAEDIERREGDVGELLLTENDDGMRCLGVRR